MSLRQDLIDFKTKLNRERRLDVKQKRMAGKTSVVEAIQHATNLDVAAINRVIGLLPKDKPEPKEPKEAEDGESNDRL